MKMLPFLIILFLMTLTYTAYSQPISTYVVNWEKESLSAKYLVFAWEGDDEFSASLRDTMDYLNPDVTQWLKQETTDTSFIYSAYNDGKLLRFGVVGVSADSLYGPMGVSDFIRKGIVPGRIRIIDVNKL